MIINIFGYLNFLIIESVVSVVESNSDFKNENLGLFRFLNISIFKEDFFV